MGTHANTGAIINHTAHQSGISKSYLGGESRYPPESEFEESQNSDIFIHHSDSEADESQDIDINDNIQPTTSHRNQHHTHSRGPTPDDDEKTKMNEKQRKEEQARIQNAKNLKILRKKALISQIIRTANDYKALQNNLIYEKVGMSRKYIHSATRAPPEWRHKPMVSIAVITDQEAQSTQFETMEAPEHNLIYTPRYGAISDTQNEIEVCGKHSLYHIYGQTEYKPDITEKVIFKEATDEDPTEIIPTKNDKWFITVPVKMADGTIISMQMLADAGANIPCINTQYAMKIFRNFICHNNTQPRILTAGSNVLKPKYLLWMTFPTSKGPLLKAKFYLVDNLPVDILADINMLRRFGYKFKDEVPPVFRHLPLYSNNLDLKDTDELHKINHTNTKDIYDTLKIYKEQKMVRMAQQAEYERAVHTHFVQMASCMSSLIKDGKIDTQTLLDPFNDHINNCDSDSESDETNPVSIDTHEESEEYTYGLKDPRCESPQTSSEESSSPAQIYYTSQITSDTDNDNIRDDIQSQLNMYDSHSDTESQPSDFSIKSHEMYDQTQSTNNDKQPQNPMINSITQCLEQKETSPTPSNIIISHMITNTDTDDDEITMGPIVQLTPEIRDSPELTPQSSSEYECEVNLMINGIPFTNVREVSISATENDSVIISNTQSKEDTPNTRDNHGNSIIVTKEDSEDSIQHTVNHITSIEDIAIPGVDPIDVKRSELWHGMGNDEHNGLGGSLTCQLPSVQTRRKQGSIANNSAFRNTPTRGITTRIHGTIGGTSIKLLNNTHNVNHAIACHQFYATDEELRKAASLKLDKELKFNKLEYLKELESMYPRKYMKLYQGTKNLIEEFKHLFAKQLFDRRTLKNVAPARLGVKREYMDDVCFIRQYNIPPLQRLHMIKYTQENDGNGFWYSLKDTENCIPYTMVEKKGKDGMASRWRPAFDARGVNKWCVLKPSWMPTIRDFDEFFALKGLITIADCKNFFDCIPLHTDDQKWATVLTPLGLRRMMHLTYGWKNAAPIAQNIMNKLCLLVGWMLGYIDDMAIKHPFHYNTKQLLKHLRRFFVACDELGLLLHPSKFWPFATVVESLGIRRTLLQSLITEDYRKKVLSIPKPKTVAEMRSAKGVIQYIGRYIHNWAFYSYWLERMLKDSKKGGRLNWTDEANYAWEMIMHNVKHAQILRNPTRNGTFCIKTDASKYGIGAVLYQLQYDTHKQEWKWFIIDMYSAIIKEDLRKSHSMVHEALAIVKACEHWQFHLLKRQFKISCDNRPIVHIFDEKQEFDPTTRQQLGRLRTQLRGFSFDIAHVPGIKNALPDALSRFTAKFETPKQTLAKPIISTDTGNKLLTSDELNNLEKKHTQTKISVRSNDINNTTMLISNFMAPNDKQGIYQTMMKSQKHMYNKICGDFKARAIHTQRRRVRRYINTQAKALIIGNEYRYNTQPCINMIQQMQPIMQSISNMTDESIDILGTLTESEELAHTGITYESIDNEDDCKENTNNGIIIQNEDTDDEITDESDNNNDILMIQNQLANNKVITIKDHSLLNIIQSNFDDTYQCCTNDANKPTYVKPTKSKRHHMQTRSKTKRQIKKIRPKTHRTDYINPESDRLVKRLQTQDDFIHELVGYRTQMNFFDAHTFRTYQESDYALQTLRYLLSNKIYTPKYQSDKIKLDLEFIREYHKDLYTAWAKKDLRIHPTTKIIQKCMKYTDYAPRWLDVVPEVLIGRIMDYGHHNLSLNHLGAKATMDSILADYWWDTMEHDIKVFIKECQLCQYVKHGKTLKAPMRIRELPKPREHIMADFLDCILGKYHILVIVDYGSNYAMLVPCEHCDTRAVVDALLTKWIPVFGLFSSFETDFGAAFNNNVMKILTKITGIKHTFAEARNHRGIGKVERLIGYIQTIFNLYNVNSDNQLIPQDHSFVSKRAVWQRVKAILPFVQQSINRRKPRFTQYSPNMIMFGSELNDYGNIKKMIQQLNQPELKETIKQTDYEYMHDLLTRLDTIQSSYDADWRKYTRYSAKSYNERYKIDSAKDKMKILEQFKRGDQILYYVGDRQVAGRKWRQRWSGPWHIKSIDSDTVAIEIEDRETTNSKYVSVDRIKPWNNGRDTITLSEFEELETHQDSQKQQLQGQYGF